MNLNLGYMKSDTTGYGRMSHQLADAIARQGVTCDPVSTGYTPPGKDAVNVDEGAPVHANAMWIGMPSHVRGWWEGQRSHVFTMWEAMVLPPAFHENMHEFDTIIVPSQQNVELFSRHHHNVKKVGLGVDPRYWHYVPRQEPGTEFRFMTAGQGNRKGIDVVKRAFDTVFGTWQPGTKGPIPTLTIKNRAQNRDNRGPRTSEVSTTLDAAGEAALYETAHCFVGMSRGEGWGLMPFQAMAQGCPTILADAHGYAEFSHLASAKVSTSLVKADAFIFGDAGEWWEPNHEELCEAMWDIYCNYEDYLAPAQFSAAVIADDYSWDKQATRVIHAIGGPQVLDLPDITEREWHVPSTSLFHIVPNRDCEYEVNGVHRAFKQGKDY